MNSAPPLFLLCIFFSLTLLGQVTPQCTPSFSVTQSGLDIFYVNQDTCTCLADMATDILVDTDGNPFFESCPAGQSIQSIAADGSVVCHTDVDTNAGTSCGTHQFLDGDGVCRTVPDCDGATQKLSYDQATNSFVCNVDQNTDTNTNAGTICGTHQFLDGDGVCRTVPDCDGATQKLAYDQSSNNFLCNADNSGGGINVGYLLFKPGTDGTNSASPNSVAHPYGGAPSGMTRYIWAGTASATDSVMAQMACEAHYGHSCITYTGDCAGNGWGPYPANSYFSSGTLVFGYAAGCSGAAGRVWSYGGSYTWFGWWYQT